MRHYLELRRCRVPLWWTALCKKAHRKRRGRNNPYTFAFKVGQQIHQSRIVDAVMTIREDHINRTRWYSIKNICKNLQRETGYSNKSRLSCCFQLLKGRDCLIYNLYTTTTKQFTTYKRSKILKMKQTSNGSSFFRSRYKLE